MTEHIPFHKPLIEDCAWVNELLAQKPERCCDYTFGNLFNWADTFQAEIGCAAGCLTARFVNPPMGHRYLYPAGLRETEAVEELSRTAASMGEKLVLVCLTEERKNALEERFPGRFEFAEDRDGADYLYLTEKMATLAGKKLHGKRNHIHRFEETYPNWRTEPITKENLAECLKMDRAWMTEKGEEDEGFLDGDAVGLHLCAKYFEEMGMEGMILRGEEDITAFCIGAPIVGSDTFDIHFEKAYPEIQGAYPMIAREFARYVQEKHPEILYLNREDDMGVEGLRKSKESFYPDLMVWKYTATLKEGTL